MSVTRRHEPVDEAAEAQGELEAQVLLEVTAQVVAIEVIQHLECHALHHVLLLSLHVELEVGAEPGLEVATHTILDMMIQFALVDIHHQRIRVEWVAELIHEDREAPDLLAQPLCSRRARWGTGPP